MQVEMSENNAIISDLMEKLSDDVRGAIMRVLSISPEPHLPIAMSAAAAAIGCLAAVLSRMPGGSKSAEPDPECVQLAGLLASRMGLSPGDGVSAAYRDLEVLQSNGRNAALGQSQ